jgi:hypothetical protein
MDNSIILALITLVGAVVGTWLKLKNENKKFEVKENLWKEEQAEHGIAIGRLESLLKKHIDNELFRMNFRNAIAKIAATKINNSELFSSSEILTKAITDFSIRMAEFGIKFNYSDLRCSKEHTENDFKFYLKTDIDSMIYDFLDILKQGILVEKAFKIGNKIHPISITGYLILVDMNNKEPGCMQLTELLLIRLVQNGLNEEKLQDIFINYIDSFIFKLKDKLQEFFALPDYDIEIEKILDQEETDLPIKNKIKDKNERFKM